MNNENTLRTDSSVYNQGTKTMQMIHEEKNSAENYHCLMEALRSGRARDVNDEPKSDLPCLIIGSGGTLDEALPKLDKWKGAIICTTSHALTLVKYGAPPTHIFALDPFCTYEEIEGVDWSQYNTKLVTTPTVWPSLVQKWPNEILLYRQNQGRRDVFYADELLHMYSDRVQLTPEQITEIAKANGVDPRALNPSRMFNWPPHIRTELTLFACSPPAQMFIAGVLGYKNIFLVGCDFAYTCGKDRFTNSTVKESVRKIEAGNACLEIPTVWEDHEHLLAPELVEMFNSSLEHDELVKKYSEKVVNDHLLTANGIPSHVAHIYYKKNMFSAWRLSLQDVWVVGKGSITEMPSITIDHLIAKQGKNIPKITNNEKIRRSEGYMAQVGSFYLETDRGGKVFIEAADPINNLTTYMTGMNRQYLCDSCGVQFTSHDDLDNTGEICQMCSKGKMVRKNYFDMKANLERIKRLLKGVKA